MSSIEMRQFTTLASFTGRSVPLARWRQTTPRVEPYRLLQFAGRGRIVGSVAEKGTPNTPVRRRVRLYQDRDGLLVRETWSNPTTGAYSFDYIDESMTYTVLSYDHTLNFRAVVADRIVPEIMP